MVTPLCTKISNKPKLEVGLVPANAWGKNIRAIVSEENWLKLRDNFCAYYDPYRNYPEPVALLTCEACGDKFSESLHLHELWDFDDKNGRQVLTGFMPVCEDCHNSIHIGRANKVGLGERAKSHLKKINSWSDEQLFEHLESASALWNKRLGIDYELDISWLIELELLTPREIHLDWLNRPARVYDHIGAITWAGDILALPNVVILDTETTGLIEGFSRYPEAEVIELAIISISGDVLYNKRFKPLYQIPSRTTKIHGITNSMVRRNPSFAKEYSKITEILHGKIAVTYNSRFDSKILANTCKLHGLPVLENTAWECAMRVLKAYLEPATRFVSLPNASHNALADCQAALDLIHKMAQGEEILVTNNSQSDH